MPSTAHQEQGRVNFRHPVDLVESVGSDKYVYFTVEGEQVAAADLEELAADAGGADLPPQDSLVTCLLAESRVRDRADARVWMNLDKIHLFDLRDGRNITLLTEEAAGAPAV